MQLCSSLSILWHCLTLGLECKLTFSSPVATAEFSLLRNKLKNGDVKTMDAPEPTPKVVWPKLRITLAPHCWLLTCHQGIQPLLVTLTYIFNRLCRGQRNLLYYTVMKAWRTSAWGKYILLSQVLWNQFWLLWVFIYLLLHEKAGLKLNIEKPKIMVSSPITSSQTDGKYWKQWQILFSWAPKSLWTMTAAMKLKHAFSLEGKLWQTWTVY